MFSVVPETPVIVSLKLVVLRAGKVTVTALPSFVKVGTVTVEPSENVNVALVT